jgi:hypothetical protein
VELRCVFFGVAPQLKESLNKFKGGALWLRELF